MKTAIITGVTGQDGSYLADLLLKEGYTVVGTTRNADDHNLKNLKYLGIKDKIKIEECDLLEFSEVLEIVKKHNPAEIYNLASQSSVGLSFKDPLVTIESNTMSVLNLLEVIREFNPGIKFYQACSSDMYGRISKLPISKDTLLHPLSPYAVSKLSSYWMVRNYRESFNLFVVAGILFNHESYLRDNNFFVKKVITECIEIATGTREVLKVGNIDIKRDFGFAPEYVKAIWLMIQQPEAEDHFICSGKSVSLRSIIEYVFKRFNIPIEKLVQDKRFFRPTDIVDIYGDNTRAREKLGWNYDMDFFEVLDLIINEELDNLKLKI